MLTVDKSGEKIWEFDLLFLLLFGISKFITYVER